MGAGVPRRQAGVGLEVLARVGGLSALLRRRPHRGARHCPFDYWDAPLGDSRTGRLALAANQRRPPTPGPGRAPRLLRPAAGAHRLAVRRLASGRSNRSGAPGAAPAGGRGPRRFPATAPCRSRCVPRAGAGAAGRRRLLQSGCGSCIGGGTRIRTGVQPAIGDLLGTTAGSVGMGGRIALDSPGVQGAI